MASIISPLLHIIAKVKCEKQKDCDLKIHPPNKCENDNQSPNLTCKCSGARQQEVSIPDSKRGMSYCCISLPTALVCTLIRNKWQGI